MSFRQAKSSQLMRMARRFPWKTCSLVVYYWPGVHIKKKGREMLYLECEVRKPAGLRDNDVLALVADHTGDREQIQVERNFLVQRGDRYFLPVWAVAQDHVKRLVEVELPEESAGGTNRIWVRADKVFYQQEEVSA